VPSCCTTRCDSGADPRSRQVREAIRVGHPRANTAAGGARSAGEGHRLRAASDHSAPGEGAQGSGDDAAVCDHGAGCGAHLSAVGHRRMTDLARGLGRAPLPDALDRKYPNAGSQWAWQFVFPAGRIAGTHGGPPVPVSSATSRLFSAPSRMRCGKHEFRRRPAVIRSGIRLRRICSRTV